MDPGKKWTSGNSPSYWAEWEGSQLRDREFLVYYPNPKFQELVKKPRKLPSPNDPVVPSQMPEVKPFLTPDKYASTDTSGFAVSVSGNTTFNADLTGPPIK